MQKFCQQLRSWQAINPVPAGSQLSVCKHAVLFGLTDEEERVKYQTLNRVQAFFNNILMGLTLGWRRAAGRYPFYAHGMTKTG